MGTGDQARQARRGHGDAVNGPHATPVRLAFLIAPQFSMMSFSAAIEPLRSANRQAGRTLYEWQLVSTDGRDVEASNGIRVAVDCALASLARPDLLVVCVSLDPEQWAAERAVLHVLRRLARHGCRVGAISSGAFVLAEAGLLAGRAATVHWEYADAFHARFPRLALVPDLYVVDREVFTCSGGTAALDLMLHFIREQCGPALAVSVAEQFMHPRIRDHGDRQRMDIDTRYGLDDPKLATAIRQMEQALEEPLPMTALARRVGVSVRQLERLFQSRFGTTPTRFYVRLRLERARALLLQGARPVREIALECGFGSTSHFCHAYRAAFQTSPTADRQTGWGARPG